MQYFMIGVTCFVIGLAALPTGSVGLLGPGEGRDLLSCPHSPCSSRTVEPLKLRGMRSFSIGGRSPNSVQ